MTSSGKSYDGMPLRPYSIQELAKLYRVSKVTFRKWLKPFQKVIGKRNGHFYSVKQVAIIINHLGVPYSFDPIDKM